MHETITWIKYGCGLPECGGRYLIQTTAVYGSVFEGMLLLIIMEVINYLLIRSRE